MQGEVRRKFKKVSYVMPVLPVLSADIESLRFTESDICNWDAILHEILLVVARQPISASLSVCIRNCGGYLLTSNQ